MILYVLTARASRLRGKGTWHSNDMWQVSCRCFAESVVLLGVDPRPDSVSRLGAVGQSYPFSLFHADFPVLLSPLGAVAEVLQFLVGALGFESVGCTDLIMFTSPLPVPDLPSVSARCPQAKSSNVV